MNNLARAATCLALLFAACASPAPTAPPPELAARLSPTWIAGAKRVRAGERVIYYHGSARPSSATPDGAWSGTISGDIIVLDVQSALIVTGGSVTLRPPASVGVSGTSQIITSEAPAWRDLLVR